MKMSPEPLPEMLPSRPESKRDAAGDPFQLVGQKRRVCGDDDDDRPGVVALGVERNFVADRHSGNPQEMPHAEIALNQHAHCVAAQFVRELARGCAGPAL